MTALDIAALAFFPGLMALAALSDLLTMTIPNRLALLGAAGFAVAAPIAGLGAGEIAFHLAAGGVLLAAGFGLFAAGWIGGGDAKLAAVAALWLGPATPDFVVWTGLCGGVVTLAVLAFRRAGLPTYADRAWTRRLHDRHGGVPYGIAIAAGAAVAFPGSAVVAGLVA